METQMKSHKRKMTAPIIISVIMVLYYMFYFGLLIFVLKGIWAILLGIIPLALSALIIAVCIQRVKEIKKGEEDDLSKY